MRRAQPHCYLKCSPLTRACQCSQMAHHSIGLSGNVSRSCGHTTGMLSVTGVCGLLHLLTSEHPLSPCLAQFQSVPTCSARLGPSAIRQPLLMSALHGCLALGEHVMSPGVLGVTPPLALFCDNMIWPVSYSLFHGHLGFYFGVITPPIHRVTPGTLVSPMPRARVGVCGVTCLCCGVVGLLIGRICGWHGAQKLILFPVCGV